MTRKDFELIAKVLRESKSINAAAWSASVRAVLAVEFADALAETNPAFDRSRFIEAATRES